VTDALAPATPPLPATGGGTNPTADPSGIPTPSLDDRYQRRVTADNAAGALERLTAKYGAKPAEPAPGGAGKAAAAPATSPGAADALSRLSEKYGHTAATAASPVPPTTEQPKPGEPASARVPLGATVGGMARATAADVIKGILVEAPRATWRGINDAVNSFGDALTEPFGVDLYKLDDKTADALGVDHSWFQSKIAAPETYTGAGIEHVSQFVAGMVPVAKALQGLGLAATVGRPLAGAAAGAIANVISGPSHGGNISNLIERVPALRNPVTGWLASDPGDGVAEGKLKQAIEGAGVGAAADSLLGALKVYREARDLKGALPEAAVSKAEGAAAQPAAAAAPAVTERDWLQLGGKPEAPLFRVTDTAKASADALVADAAAAPTPHPDTRGLPDVIKERVPVGAPDPTELEKARAQYPQAIEEATKPVTTRDLDAEPGQLRNYVIMPDGAIREAPMAHAAIVETAMRKAGIETHPDMAGDSMMEELAAGANVVHFRLTGEQGGGLGGGVDIFGDLTPRQKSVIDRLRKMTDAGGLSISSWSRPAVASSATAESAGDAAGLAANPGAIVVGDKVGNINLNRISSDDDIRNVVARVAKMMDEGAPPEKAATEADVAAGIVPRRPGSLTTTRRGWDQEQAAAEAQLQDADTVARLAGGQGSGTAFTASEARATQLIINNLGANAKVLAAKIAGGQGTDLDKAALVQLGTHMEGWLAVRSGAMREAGRTLSIGRMMGETSKSAETAIKGLMGQGASADRMAAVLNALDKPEQVEAFFRGGWWKRAGDVAFDAFRGSILSGLWTHARNNISNGLNLLSSVGERAAGAAVSQTVGSGEVLHGEAPAMAYGMVASFNDALRAGGAALRKGLGDPAAAKPEARAPAISAYRLGLNEQSWYGKSLDFYGQWVNGWAFRVLGAGDEFASTLAREAQFHALAYREAWKGSGGLEQAAAKMKQLLDTRPPEMMDQAERFARNLTLRDPMGDIGLGFAKLRKDTPFVQFVLPFLQTPGNAFKYRMARSPLAVATPTFWNDVAAGGARADMAGAKLGLGSLVGATVAGWVAQGYATGAGPNDPAGRSAWEREGRLPYAVKIGDRWVQYTQLDPVGLSLGVMADVAHMLEVADDVRGLASDPKRLDEAYQRLIKAGMRPDEANAATQAAEAHLSQGLNNLPGMLVQSMFYNVVNQSSLSGFSQIAEGLYGDTGKTTADKLTGTLRDTFLATVVPQSGALRWAERIVDPELRESKGVVEALKAMIPGMSDGLPVMPNLWGEPRTSAVARSPYATRSTADAHPIDRELGRLGYAVPMPDKAVAGVPLTPDQYAEYVGLAGNGLKAAGGLGARELLDAMVTGDARNPVAADLARKYHDPHVATDGPDGTRAAMIHAVVDGYRKAAQGEMIKRHADLRIIAEAQKLAGADARTGGVGVPAAP
jgi:hypothetical protein